MSEDGSLKEFARPEAVRHNSCFLVPRPHDPTGSAWLPPSRPLLAPFRYHEMICETIYAKGTKDLEQVAHYVESRKEREQERAEWSRDRFRNQRESAAIWAEMRQTFQEVMEPRSVVSPSSAIKATSKPPAAQDKNTGRGTDFVSPATTATARLVPLRSASEPGLSHRSLQQSPQDKGFVNKSMAATCPGWTIKQVPGTRGLPPNYIPAVLGQRGVLMWPNDRSLKRAKRML